MRLDEDAGLFFVGFAQLLARGNRLLHALRQGQGERDPGTVAAHPAKIGKAAGHRALQAGHGLRQHDRQGVFSGAARPCENERRRHPAAGHSLAQTAHAPVIP